MYRLIITRSIVASDGEGREVMTEKKDLDFDLDTCITCGRVLVNDQFVRRVKVVDPKNEIIVRWDSWLAKLIQRCNGRELEISNTKIESIYHLHKRAFKSRDEILREGKELNRVDWVMVYPNGTENHVCAMNNGIPV